jgi:ubiquinone/menaquinone biosynthesis C-methylase UbiE
MAVCSTPSLKPPGVDAVKRLTFLLLAVVAFGRPTNAADKPAAPDPLYERRPGSYDGTGKWFLGREIAHFMSHEGAPWLEREERVTEEEPARLLEALDLKPGMQIGDVGAGSGYLSWRMARAVGPAGLVHACDIQPEMIAILKTNVAAHGVSNVVAVLSTTTDPKLPVDVLDLVILVDVYHECDHPYEMARGMVAALKPGGRLVLVEYRGEDKWVPIKPLHKMTEAQVRKELALHEIEFVENRRVLPRQHILIFRKPPAAGAGR